MRVLAGAAFTAALLATVATGCSDGGITGPSAPPPAPSENLIGTAISTVSSTAGALTSTVGATLDLLTCSPQSYAKATESIGPAGGSISVSGHKLVVPRGALSRTVTITMETPSSRVRSVRFSPEGLRFKASAKPTLTMSYSGCLLPHGALLGIDYVSESLNLLETLKSTVDLRQKTVSAGIGHFSRYAIHY
ncbi:MAG TPA: hypothetical protein VFW66_14610 [Gemmatimonadales bacterium]|nr:hypothetical protein [Gemmatimonadales bacterium]